MINEYVGKDKNISWHYVVIEDGSINVILIDEKDYKEHEEEIKRAETNNLFDDMFNDDEEKQ